MEVGVEHATLSDATIDYFIDLVNRTWISTREHDLFNLKKPSELENPYLLGQFRSNKIDVQILFGMKMDGERIPGHYMCICFKKSENKVYVYDSKRGARFNKHQEKIVRILYPKHGMKIVFDDRIPAQENESSSGIYALAFAITLLRGGDLPHFSFKLNNSFGGDETIHMRLEIFKMFYWKMLIPLTSNEKNSTKKSETNSSKSRR